MTTLVEDHIKSSGHVARLLPHEKEALTCEEAAAERSVPLDEMVKCIVLAPKGQQPVVACVRATDRLSMKKVKQLLGAKSLSSLTDEEILKVTGFRRGAIPPFALPDSVRVLGDISLKTLAKLNISSGDPCLGLEISKAAFQTLFSGRFTSIRE